MSKPKTLFVMNFILICAFFLVGISLIADGQSVQSTDGKGGAKKTVVAYVSRTGQTTSYAPGDDGDLRAGVPWPVPRFIDNRDGTVTDRLTQLMWVQDGMMLGWYDWAGGLQACNDLVYAGYSDWRMPNIREMESLRDHEIKRVPAGNPFVNCEGQRWTSTTHPTDSLYSQAWVWSDRDASNPNTKDQFYFVWPVRGPVPKER